MNIIKCSNCDETGNELKADMRGVLPNCVGCEEMRESYAKPKPMSIPVIEIDHIDDALVDRLLRKPSTVDHYAADDDE